MQETFNPILSQEDVRGWSLTKEIPVPAPNTVLVLSRSGGGLEVISHTGKPISFSRFKFGGYNFLYTVDVGKHILKIECPLPSSKPGFDFPTTLQIECFVSNPKIIVESNIQDVSLALSARLIDEMKQVSRDYDLQENAVAEKDINRSVRRRVIDQNCFGDLGLQILQLVASLQISDSAIEDIKRGTLAGLRKDALLAEKRAEQEVKQIDQEYYEKLIRGGEVSLLAAYLAQNPENITELIKRFDQQNQLASGSNMELLKIMIQEDALEGSQLGDAGMRVLRRLMGLTESPKAALEGDSAKQEPSPLSDEDKNDDDDDDSLNDVPS